MDTFEVGDTIEGKYTITRVLGQGGMGKVVAAIRPGLSTLVALKVLLPALRDKPEVVGRFSREARACDALRSEHVARVLDVGRTTSGTPFIVMEHLTGQSLAALIDERRQLDVALASDLLLQACEPICEAHTLGIIHRDLKPANLYVTTSVDGLPFVKVLDFGISKVSFPGDLVVTETGAFFGSPLYMAPEQLARPTDADPRSDVWALGIILYEMLTGVTPFTGDTLPVVSASILIGKYAKLSTVRSDLPEGLDALVTDALAPKPESRVQSVAEFARRLAPFGTAHARQSYERIERLAGGVIQPVLPDLKTTAPPLEETAPPLASSLQRSDPKVPTNEAPAPPKAARSRAVPALVGLAGVAIVGGYVGFRQMHSAAPSAPAAAAASLPVLEIAPSASAVLAAPAPSASIAPVASASSAPADSAPVVRAVAPAAALPAGPSVKPGTECSKGATAACEAACAAHAPGRCEALAKALLKGTGAAKNVARASTLLQAECDSGAGSACDAVGGVYAAGKDVPKDSVKAVAFYKRGCEREDPTSCVDLGSMHFEGDGVPKNQALGVTYFLRGCPSSGRVEPLGCLNLYVAYTRGLGVPKDPSQAFLYAKQACDHGSLRGCTLMSEGKLSGDGAAKDVPGALAELDGLCGRGESEACAKLIGTFARGLGTDIPRDPARARYYAEKGCAAHDATSCRVKDMLEKQDNSDTSAAQSNAQLDASCHAGVMTHCGFLGERKLAGLGMPVDHDGGVALLRQACAAGVARSCQKLGEAGER